MSAPSVVPWWGRWLPHACGFFAVGCFMWSLDLAGLRALLFLVGLALWDLALRINDVNNRADRQSQ